MNDKDDNEPSSNISKTQNPSTSKILSKDESEVITNELKKLVEQLRLRKKSFSDKSRLFCCGCFSICMVSSIIVFYIFDVLKYEESCNKNKNNQLEICDVHTIGFWTRLIFLFVSVSLLIIGLYCTGSTVVIFEPSTNRLTINKKKLICLPSICEYKLENLSHAYLETDSSDGMLNMSTFTFYSVILVFNTDPENVVNLGLGRDCFYIKEKIELVKEINKYLNAISN